MCDSEEAQLRWDWTVRACQDDRAFGLLQSSMFGCVWEDRPYLHLYDPLASQSLQGGHLQQLVDLGTARALREVLLPLAAHHRPLLAAQPGNSVNLQHGMRMEVARMANKDSGNVNSSHLPVD